MKIEEVIQECKRLKRSLGRDFEFMGLMRGSYGMTFVITEVVDKLVELEDEIEESRLIRYLRSGKEERELISLDRCERLSLLLRLFGVGIYLPRLDCGKDGLELPFQTIEAATSWALTSFWSVAKYKTIDEFARFYADKAFDHPPDIED